MAEDRKKKLLKCRQSKANNSSIAIYTRKNFRCITLLWSYKLSISIQFHEFTSIGYKAMSEDGKIIVI